MMEPEEMELLEWEPVKRKAFWKQKKWWAGVVGVLVPILNHVFDVGLDAGTVTQIVIVIVGYVIAEAWTDATH